MPIEGVGTATLLTRPNPTSTSSTSENREAPSANSAETAPSTTSDSVTLIPPTPTEGATQEGNSEGASNFDSSANSANTSASEAEVSEGGNSEQRVDLTV